MRIEVVYALPLQQDCTVVECRAGATVREAIENSGILRRHPDIDLTRIGIWGKRCSLDERLREGDRVELYRPLGADPKEVRRARAGRRSGRG
jgi:hypothetical protein